MKQRIVSMDCFKGDSKINISEAIEAIIEAQDEFYVLPMYGMMGHEGYKTAIANILQELLDTGGVGKEYMEVEK